MTVQSSDWQNGYRFTPDLIDSEYAMPDKSVIVSASAINQQVLDHGVILTYVRAGGSSYFTDRWTPLPYSFTKPLSSTVQNVSATASVGQIEFEYYLTNTATPTDINSQTVFSMDFRYVVLSSAALSAARFAGVSTNNPDTLLRFLKSQ